MPPARVSRGEEACQARQRQRSWESRRPRDPDFPGARSASAPRMPGHCSRRHAAPSPYCRWGAGVADLPTVPALNRRAVSGNPQKGSPLRRGAGTARRRRLVHGPFLKVVLDANVVLGAVASRGVGEAIVELYRERHPTLTGAEILSEVSRKLRLPQATAMSYHCRLAVNRLKGSTHAAVIANRLPRRAASSCLKGRESSM